MIVIACLFIGALVGVYSARRRQGTGFDIAQYAAVHAIMFGILGLFLTLLIDRLV
ncbi:MAG: apolipoprotein acyltransferase [Paracoccaceae bacterium]